jgi:hypothetical protein
MPADPPEILPAEILRPGLPGTSEGAATRA